MPELIPVRSVRTGGLDHIEVPTRDEALIAALVRERDGYRRTGRDAQALEVDVELDRLGYVDPSTDPVKGAEHDREPEPDQRADRRQPSRRRPAAGGQ
jgi:hypothetical protein